MEPAKQENVSRQSSSILKPPKQRQPLQTVGSGASSSESTPTVKIKRRVSFAKNKRIREFCNEAEQGTIWDDTYEENDLSSSKSNSTGGPTAPVIINLPNHDKENFPINLYIEPDQLECQEIVINTSIPSQMNDLLHSEIEMNNFDPSVGEINQHYPDSTIYCDDGMDITAALPSNILPLNHTLPNKTVYYDENMEITSAVRANTIHSFQPKKKNQRVSLIPVPIVEKQNIVKENETQTITSILKKKSQYATSTTIHYDEGMEMTAAVPSNLILTSHKNPSFYEDTLPVSRTTSSNLNEPMPSIMQQVAEKLSSNELILNGQKSTHESCLVQISSENKYPNKTVYCDDGMEMTAGVPSNLFQAASRNQMYQNPLKQAEKENELPNATVYCDDGMEMTAAIPSNLTITGSNGHSFYEDTLPVSRTTSLNLKRVARPSIMQQVVEKISSSNLSQKFLGESSVTPSFPLNKNNQFSNATVYSNDGMEITAAIPPSLPPLATKKENLPLSRLEKNGLVNDRDTTTDIFSKNLPVESRNLTILNNEIVELSNVTRQYNDGMEMTAPVTPTVFHQTNTNQRLLNENQIRSIQKENTYPNTTVYCDDGMEMTTAVSSNLSQSTLKNKRLLENSTKLVQNENKYPNTTVYCDDGMEMTAAVPSNRFQDAPRIQNLYENSSKSAMNENKYPNITVHCADEMEMTAAVPSNLSQATPRIRNLYENSSKLVQKENKYPNTTVYCDDGMEMTTAVPSNLSQSTLKNKRLLENSTKLVQNENKYPNTTVYCDDGMEMTAAVPSNLFQGAPRIQNLYENSSKSAMNGNKYPNITEHCEDKMEITTAQPSNMIHPTSSNNSNCEDTLPLSQDTSLNVRENTSSVIKQISKKLSLFNSSGGMGLINKNVPSESENISLTPKSGNKRQLPDETIHEMDGMEITCAIPSSIDNNNLNYQTEKNSEQNTNYVQKNKKVKYLDTNQKCNNGVELSTLVSNSVSEQSKYPNQIHCHGVAEMANVIPSNIINNQQPNISSTGSKVLEKENNNMDISEKTIFCNNGMEMTAVISASIKLCQKNTSENQNSLKLGINEINTNISDISEAITLHKTRSHDSSKLNLKENYDLCLGNRENEMQLSNQTVRLLDNMEITATLTANIFSSTNKNHSKTVLENSQNNSFNVTESLSLKKKHENVSKLGGNLSAIGINNKYQTFTINSQRISNVTQNISLENSDKITQEDERIKEIESSESNLLKNNELNFTEETNADNLALSDKNQTNSVFQEDKLDETPSDDTELFLGFKTSLSHPIMINDENSLQIFNNKSMDKTNSSEEISDKITPIDTYTFNTINNIDKSVLDYPLINQIDDQNDSTNSPCTERIPSPKRKNFNPEKENEETAINMNSLLNHYSKELEEIEPPSFLCSDSIHSNSENESMKMDHDQCEEIFYKKNSEHEENTNLHIKSKDKCMASGEGTEKNKDINLLELQVSDVAREVSLKNNKECIFSSEKILDCEQKKDKESIKLSNCKKKFKNSKKKKNKPELPKLDDTPPVVEPLSPWLLLLNNIKSTEARDDCIWSIQKTSSEMIAVNFISESLFVIIRLNEPEAACNRDIKEVELFSRLRAKSRNTLMKIAHNLILSKVNPNNLLEQYKLYEDVLPMLEYISNEVIAAMKFMFELERLSAYYLFEIEENRLSFMVSSKECNIILKIYLPVKVFEEITADDIDVKSVLGDIKLKDIQLLINNVRKDYNYLTRYIKDIESYITLMEDVNLKNNVTLR